MRTVGILVCGCGVYDGSDVQEAVLVAAALEARGLRTVFVSPSGDQAEVVDHATGSAVEGAPPRDLLSESARIARGSIRPLDELLAGELDALVIPGGVGVVRNLCLADDSPLGAGALRPEVAALLADLKQRGGPVAALGLARVIVSRFRGGPIETDLLHAGPLELLREDGGRVLLAAGFLGTSKIDDVARVVEAIAGELAERLGASRALRVLPRAADERT